MAIYHRKTKAKAQQEKVNQRGPKKSSFAKWGLINISKKAKPSFESLLLLLPVAFAFSACPINAFQLFFSSVTSVPLPPVKEHVY